MLLIIIILLSIALGVLTLFISCIRSSDILFYSSGGLLLIAVLALICIIPDIISTRIEFDYVIEKYHNLERQINTTEYDDIVTDKNLRNQVLDMNNVISEHKVKSKNILVNLWFSEEIGNLKPLEWKSKETGD